MQEVLSRWEAWLVDNTESVQWYSIVARLKGLISPSSNSCITCSDDDGLLIDGVISNLKRIRKEDGLELIVTHYIYGISKRSIAKLWNVSEGRIRQQMQVVDGYLAMLNVPLEIDIEVMKKGK